MMERNPKGKEDAGRFSWDLVRVQRALANLSLLALDGAEVGALMGAADVGAA